MNNSKSPNMSRKHWLRDRCSGELKNIGGSQSDAETTFANQGGVAAPKTQPVKQQQARRSPR
jgi:hypothetical protein